MSGTIRLKSRSRGNKLEWVATMKQYIKAHGDTPITIVGNKKLYEFDNGITLDEFDEVVKDMYN